MFIRLGRISLIALFLLALDAAPSIAKTVQIHPPGSLKADNATHNIVDVIETLRAGGFKREANQVKELLNNGRAFYRTTGKNMYDAQLVPDLTDASKDRLYFSVYDVNYVAGKGPERHAGSEDGRQLYKTVLTSLHEMVHRDQGPYGIGPSSLQGGGRGYALHEIEAYRVSMKKFAGKWVVGEIDRFLKDRKSMPLEERVDMLGKMRHKLDALQGSLGAPAKNGDKACRWAQIGTVTKKLSDQLDSLWLDAMSRRDCRHHLENGDLYKQNAVEIRLKFNTLGEAMKADKSALESMAKAYKDGNAKYGALRSKLENSATKPRRRQQLADEIGPLTANLDDLLERYNSGVRAYNDNIANHKKLRDDYNLAVQKQSSESSGFDQCRIDSIASWMTRYKLGNSRLPPDMEKQSNGKIRLLADNEKRQIDLAAVRDELEKMFDYDTKLLGPAEAAVADDPRTPCYKPQKTATAPAPAPAKPKKKCSGGGLTGAMNCVADRIEQGG